MISCIIIIVHNLIKNIKKWKLFYIKCCAAIYFIFLSSAGYAFPFKGLDLKIETSITEMYDDNLLFERDNKKEDFITTLGLGLDANYEGRRRTLDVGGRLNHRFNARFSEIKNSSENFSLKFNNDFSEYDRMSLGYSFNHAHSPAGFEEELGRITRRQETFRNSANLSYKRDISDKVNVGASSSYTVNSFSDENRSDTSNNTYGLNMNYLYSIATTFSSAYSYSEDNFDNSAQTVTVGMRKYLTRRLFLDGKVGMNFSKSSNGRRNSRIHTNIALTDEIDETTSASLLLQKSDQTAFDVGDIFSSWQITGLITKQISEKLVLNLSGFYGEGLFETSDIENQLIGMDMGISIDLWEDINGRIDYSYSNFDSTFEESGYIRNAFSLMLSKTF